tara:strand:- start:312 stop:983 length:672 start_codon:yes stop_codon:yes gene_type:complete
MMGHNVRTCPSAAENRRRVREQQSQVFQPQTPPDSPPDSSSSPTTVAIAYRERIRQMEREQQERRRQRRQAEAQRRQAEHVQRQQAQRAIMVDMITEEQQTRDAAIDHSIQQIQNWSRRLQREVDERRTLNLPQSKKPIKLKMIDNIDDCYGSDACPICLDSYDNPSKTGLALKCKHIVCVDCTSEIVKRKQFNCPCCREEFDEIHICRGISSDAFNTISECM